MNWLLVNPCQQIDKVLVGKGAFDEISNCQEQQPQSLEVDAHMMSTLRGRDDLLRLWLSQKGICPICQQKITKQTGWHSHHVVWKVHGGQDGLDNRVLLHPNCHFQVHAQCLQVVKSRPHSDV